jgi:hypothetical protein
VTDVIRCPLASTDPNFQNAASLFFCGQHLRTKEIAFDENRFSWPWQFLTLVRIALWLNFLAVLSHCREFSLFLGLCTSVKPLRNLDVWNWIVTPPVGVTPSSS